MRTKQGKVTVAARANKHRIGCKNHGAKRHDYEQGGERTPANHFLGTPARLGLTLSGRFAANDAWSFGGDPNICFSTLFSCACAGCPGIAASYKTSGGSAIATPSQQKTINLCAALLGQMNLRLDWIEIAVNGSMSARNCVYFNHRLINLAERVGEKCARLIGTTMSDAFSSSFKTILSHRPVSGSAAAADRSDSTPMELQVSASLALAGLAIDGAQVETASPQARWTMGATLRLIIVSCSLFWMLVLSVWVVLR